eukprot:CAMPEP_0197074932 /NCGR_PEP_ID=MMETSP1384-20130603/211356_1 /TAXON_ID=29189 /ORGANISM="Ammonia sp." /LENGTH=409 /DNA_ID=CAMNT_0042513773 /DNA_START=23 /DNA_END=1252 /DNA_ORIENTATION=-
MLAPPSNGAPIKINTSMTTMAMSPQYSHDNSSHSVSSLKSVSPRAPPKSPLKTPYFPKSPISPGCVSSSDFPDTAQPLTAAPATSRRRVKCSPEETMKSAGYVPFRSIASTLQGSIWKVNSNTEKGSSVIKVTKKSLHKKSVAEIDGQQIDILEDVIKETAILKYLTSSNPPESLAKFESFFTDKQHYYLVMEDAGDGLFEFVTKCHAFIEDDKLSVAEWLRFCRAAFKQMVDVVHWLHTKMNCCHLDISLENFVIDNVMVSVDPDTQRFHFADGFVIKIVDFGLAEVFTKTRPNGEFDFSSTKYVGKTVYKSPEVYAKKRAFDARSADCWSLGACLFMMLVGGSPYNKPSKNDAAFSYLISGEIVDLLAAWNRIDRVTAKSADLLIRIFRKEAYRINIDDIKKHPWLL